MALNANGRGISESSSASFTICLCGRRSFKGGIERIGQVVGGGICVAKAVIIAAADVGVVLLGGQCLTLCISILPACFIPLNVAAFLLGRRGRMGISRWAVAFLSREGHITLRRQQRLAPFL